MIADTTIHDPQQDFETLLEDISACFLRRDLAPWGNRILLPFSIITRDGPVLLKTQEAVDENFENYREACAKMRLTLISRRPVALENCHDGTWLGTYQTRLISHDQLATAPYTSTALLQPVDGRFRMSSILNARGHHEWTGLTPMGSSEPDSQ